jgi:hypothetical protein
VQGYCWSQNCVGVSPVPEPDLPEDAVFAVLAVLWIRPRDCQMFPSERAGR